METPYREAARRRARKEKALKAGQDRQKRIEELRKRREELRARRAAASRRRKAAGSSRPARPGPDATPKKTAGQGFVDPRSNTSTKLCPHCNTKLVSVVCLQKPVLACVNCRGIALSGDVVKQFATQGGWFSELDAAVSLYARRGKAR